MSLRRWDRYRLTELGEHATEMCASPACPCDEARAVVHCIVCLEPRCEHPACSQTLVRPDGNVALCAGEGLCRTAFGLREKLARGEVQRG